MNDNDNVFPVHLNTSPVHNSQQSVSDDFLNNNVTNFSDHNHQSSNDSIAISPDNNYQQYDALSSISLYSSQQFMSNDTSNDNDAISPDHNNQQYDASNYASNNNVTIFPDHYHQQYDTSNNISLYNSQQSMSYGVSNDSSAILAGQQCNVALNDSITIPSYNYQQSMFDDNASKIQMQYVDQNPSRPPLISSLNITINSPQDLSEIFRFGFKIVIMPVTN
ncbi:hypothetical protein C1645_842376 [Glomus cerebriforme]|uniref:Uncharacterized protein n=1 Tax=Glomus cerebriforme TaxID=658196 RepID=A0A397RYI6_9GLOM|nr:hypothetical protein C1645_842376 [Glomus cerebriforme]